VDSQQQAGGSETQPAAALRIEIPLRLAGRVSRPSALQTQADPLATAAWQLLVITQGVLRRKMPRDSHKCVCF